jgi:hypothetical protein
MRGPWCRVGQTESSWELVMTIGCYKDLPSPSNLLEFRWNWKGWISALKFLTSGTSVSPKCVPLGWDTDRYYGSLSHLRIYRVKWVQRCLNSFCILSEWTLIGKMIRLALVLRLLPDTCIPTVLKGKIPISFPSPFHSDRLCLRERISSDLQLAFLLPAEALFLVVLGFELMLAR